MVYCDFCKAEDSSHFVGNLISGQAYPDYGIRLPVAQLVEHWAGTREIVSSTPAGPTLRVLK